MEGEGEVRYSKMLLNITDEQRRWLDGWSEATGIPKAQIIRDLIEEARRESEPVR